MKTLTLHINDSIYDKVKNFLVLIPPEKIVIQDNSEINNAIEDNFFNKREFEKILLFFKKFNIPFPESHKRKFLNYDVSDLETDISNLKSLNLLK